MNWSTGNWTSYPEDGRAFIERDDRGWWVYGTVEGGDDDGRILVTRHDPLAFAPALHPDPFPTVEAAQRWAEMNIPARN